MDEVAALVGKVRDRLLVLADEHGQEAEVRAALALVAERTASGRRTLIEARTR